MITFTITGPQASAGGRGAILAAGDPIPFDWRITDGTISPEIGNVQGHIRLDNDHESTVWDSPIIDPTQAEPWHDVLNIPPALYTTGLHALHFSVSGLRG